MTNTADTGFTELEGQAWWGILRSSTLVLRALGSDMQDDGLQFEWFDVLINVYQYPGEAMPLSSLADNAVLSRSGLTRLLDRMERDGLLERRLSTTDRRRFDVLLTAKGRAEFERVWPRHQQAVRDRCLQHLTAADQKAIHQALAKVITANEA
jgi:DNA-binding MarR family transcriptional regulator